MSWGNTCPMDERERFIGDCRKRTRNMTDLCLGYGISRKTGYKWLERARDEGRKGLQDQSRAPLNHPNETPAHIRQMLIDFRLQYPYWGPKKAVHRLRMLNPEIAWPAASTAGDILKRHGLVKDRRRHRRTPIYPLVRQEACRPNDVWAADFKGWFRTKNGSRVDPLTITDLASRFLITCHGQQRPDGASTRRGFERAFRTHGLPAVIRTDNGTPFASVGIAGLSSLSIWWIRLGILPERGRPGKPQDNGQHERMHKDLKAETQKSPAADPEQQQRSFDEFQQRFNNERPHESLGMKTPAGCYRPSERRMPDRLPTVEYDSSFDVRRVRHNGEIRLAGELLYLSELLRGEPVGATTIDGESWGIFYGPMPLATYDVRRRELKRL